MNAEKVNFLKHRFILLLKQIPSDTPPQWGKMALQQMIEHFADSVRVASGKTLYNDVLTPEIHLEKMRNFIMNDKPFRENTVNPLVPVVPAPVKNPSVEDAIADLQKELHYFFSWFEEHPFQVTRNPLFGDLNYEENLHLLYKHALH